MQQHKFQLQFSPFPPYTFFLAHTLRLLQRGNCENFPPEPLKFIAFLHAFVSNNDLGVSSTYYANRSRVAIPQKLIEFVISPFGGLSPSTLIERPEKEL
jgi:hypothetical protein